MIRLLLTPFRWFFKLLFFLFFLAILAVFGFFYFSDYFLERQIRNSTGFPVEVGSLDISLVQTRFTMLDVEIRNPVEYPVESFMRISRFSGDIRPSTLWSESKEFHEVVLYIDDLTLVDGPDGELNFWEFWTKANPDRSPFLPTGKEGVEHSSPILIERLAIRLGVLRMATMLTDREEAREYPFHLDLVWRDVRSLADILADLEERIGADASQRVVFTLAEGLYGVERFLGMTESVGHDISGTGQFLWEKGVDAVGTVKNIIEERKQ